ncbi:hypothetical protein SAMN05216361_3647 [Marisediminitalea aggregata]|uniref:Uncharacterized protein n=1 Tax=Marisediminitalea aggregata TaxID=634436 RepID=A0A1M5PXE3_9ALTE|nr:hypothetical protein SAMN05216361_3647 [Marisediminitalea aggregata]
MVVGLTIIIVTTGIQQKSRMTGRNKKGHDSPFINSQFGNGWLSQCIQCRRVGNTQLFTQGFNNSLVSHFAFVNVQTV